MKNHFEFAVSNLKHKFPFKFYSVSEISRQNEESHSQDEKLDSQDEKLHSEDGEVDVEDDTSEVLLLRMPFQQELSHWIVRCTV